MTIDLYRLLIVISAATVAGCWFLVHGRARGRQEGLLLQLVFLCEFLIILGHLLENLCTTLEAKLFWDSVQLIFDGWLAVAYFAFAASYAGRTLPRTRWFWFGLLSPSCFSGIYYGLSPYHGWARGEAVVVPAPMPVLTYPFELLDYIVFLEVYGLLFIALGLFILSGFTKHKFFLTQIFFLSLSVTIPASGALLIFSGPNVLGERDILPFLFALGSVIATFGLMRARVFEIAPLARDLLIESQTDAIVVLDRAGQILDANPTAHELMTAHGMSRDQIGHRIEQILPGWCPLGVDETGTRIEQEEKTWEVRKFSVEDEGWLLIGRDVSALVATERALSSVNQKLEQRVIERTRDLKEANEALLQEISVRKTAELVALSSEKKFRAIFDNASHFIGLLDPQGKVLAVNRAAQEVAALVPDEILGEHFSEIAWWGTKQAGLFQVMLALESAKMGRFSRFELQLTRDGRLHYIDCSMKPVFTQDRVESILFEGRDITQVRQAELDRAQMSTEREHAERMEIVGRLAGGVAHDFNNLLTVMLAATSVLRATIQNENAQHAILDIEQAAESATSVTRQLLSLSRRREGSVEPTDVHTLIERMSKLFERLLGERHRLELSLCGDRPFILIDPGQLEQCLLNLVINARDAMPSGGSLRILTQVEPADSQLGRSGDELHVSVQDEGIGMSEEIRERIFEPFFTTKPIGHGTGLGLSTVRDFVENAHGTVSLSTAEGQGTTFELIFPVCSPEPSPLTLTEPTDLTGTETIAFVEDLATLRDWIGGELRRLGYDVHTFSSAEQALQQIELHELKFDLLVTDVLLPGQSGVELSNILRSRSPHLPVLYTTGYSGDTRFDLQNEEALSRLVYKPYRTPVIAQKIRELIQATAKLSTPRSPSNLSPFDPAPGED